MSTSAAARCAPASSRCRSTSARSSFTTNRSRTMAYPAGYKYTKDHEWVEASGASGKVGITDYAQKQLGDVVYLELPEVGTTLKAGQSFGTVESVKAVSELYSPVSGEVVAVNADLKAKPETINADPHGSWMIVVKVADGGDTGGLMDAAQYAALVE